MATAKRVRFIVTKWGAFEEELASLEGIFQAGDYEITNVKLRMTGLIEKYRAFEGFKDELQTIQSDHALLNNFVGIRDRYYAIIASIENTISAHAEIRSVASSSSENVGFLRADPTRRRIKLPTATLPTFEGKYEEWLSFKEAFTAMIHSQTDILDLEKFQYLKAALKGEAENKIKVFAMTNENYLKAWKLLERSYEVKRLLINQHLAKLTNLPSQKDETTQGLDKLADDVQQHSETLASLGVAVPSEMLVHIVESKLHKKTAERWEESLERDEVPTIDKMCEFLYKTAVCVSKRNKRGDTSQDGPVKGPPPAKKGRFDKHNQKQYALLTNASNACVVCKNVQHPLFRCEKFKALTVPKRIEIVKSAKLCYNCLRSHKDRACMYGNCTVCAKRHNTMLHLSQFAPAKPAKPSSSKTPGNDRIE